jgi:hypothetical protein
MPLWPIFKTIFSATRTIFAFLLCHTLGSIGFQGVFCCFSRIENVKAIHIDSFAFISYMGERNGKSGRVFGKSMMLFQVAR